MQLHKHLKKNICNSSWRHCTHLCFRWLPNLTTLWLWFKKSKTGLWPNYKTWPTLSLFYIRVFFFYFLKRKSAPGFPLSDSALASSKSRICFCARKQTKQENEHTNSHCISNTHSFCYSQILDLQHNILHCVNLICVWSCQELLSARIHDLSGSVLYLSFLLLAP